MSMRRSNRLKEAAEGFARANKQVAWSIRVIEILKVQGRFPRKHISST